MHERLVWPGDAMAGPRAEAWELQEASQVISFPSPATGRQDTLMGPPVPQAQALPVT